MTILEMEIKNMSIEQLKGEWHRKRQQYDVCSCELTWRRLERECNIIRDELRARGAI